MYLECCDINLLIVISASSARVFLELALRLLASLPFLRIGLRDSFFVISFFSLKTESVREVSAFETSAGSRSVTDSCAPGESSKSYSNSCSFTDRDLSIFVFLPPYLTIASLPLSEIPSQDFLSPSVRICQVSRSRKTLRLFPFPGRLNPGLERCPNWDGGLAADGRAAVL